MSRLSLALPTPQPRLSALLPATSATVSSVSRCSPPVSPPSSGAAYTSVSFLKTVHPFIAKNDKWFIVGFIAFSTLVMAILGGAKRMVILAGALNGLILPISLCCMLLGCHKKSIVGEYKHPVWLQILGWCVVGVAGYLAVTALPNLAKLFA